MSSSSVASDNFSASQHRRGQRIILSIAAMSAVVGMSLAAFNSYLGEEGFAPSRTVYRANVRPRLAASKRVSLHGGAGGSPTLELTPEIVRAILNMPEQQQMALVLPAGTSEEAARQQVMIQKALAGVVKQQARSLSGLHDEEGHGEGHGEEGEEEEHEGLEEEEGVHVLTPSQVKTERLWALIFVTGIVTASIFFEMMKEIVEGNTPPAMAPVVAKFFAELATLGFIGTIAFVLTTGFAGHDSIMGHLSFWFTGDQELLIHEFEILHFLIFFVMVFFITVVLVILQIAVNQKLVWGHYEEHLLSVVKSVQSVEERTLEIVRLLQMDPAMTAQEGTVTAEYAKPKVVRQAEFIRFRHRFIQDADCAVAIPPDFAFAEYLTKKIAKVLAEVVEITVLDWAFLWFTFLCLFTLMVLAQAIYPPLGKGDNPVYVICSGFGLLQVTLVVFAVIGFRSLAYIRAMLVPQLSSEELKLGQADLGILVTPPRYESAMKLVVKDKSMFQTLLSYLVTIRKPSKHEQLFGAFGSQGPKVFIHIMKLILLLSVVSVASMCVILFAPLWELSPVLPFVALIPSIVCIFLTPRMVILYTWCCSVEMLKDVELMMEVLREQKQEKLVNILQILSMLSFFLDQVESLKAMTASADDSTKEGISDEQWKALLAKNDPKVVEDLEALFVAYDDDDSGELDAKEVRELVGQLGTSLTDAEADNLFKVMDADGGGSVDFKEFATVMLHQRDASRGNTNYAALAEKMFDIFDKDKTGQIEQEEVLEQMERMGKNWDREGIQYFFSQIDRDNSGVIDKDEFIEYISKVQSEISGV
eukprot:CAMPEP_0180221312 /NCGR_PEP_ID=MMETSP0987-20121128/19789_1 /TAXON_ID=697907 /ORGANISM="non described non described, Strain CCMP2293" /LENGTH=814 /DNA_ID=CAMNT_0022182683 /DNA_START=95 /DNA_END=2539 /DNA_ORIENTATION=-